MRILYFVSIFLLSEGCDWLEDIKEKNVKLELAGNGLHRKLILSTKLASLNRFSDCRLLYELIIPAGAYIDTDNVNGSLSHHRLLSQHRFDVEGPRSHSKPQKVLILSTSQIRKSFVMDDKLILPIHLRYHTAVEGAYQQAEVVFKTPTVLLDCPTDFVPLKLASCKGKRSYSAQGLASESPSWMLVEPLEKSSVTALLPVADKTQVLHVLAATTAVMFLGLFMMFTAKEAHAKTG